jgi:4-hydroxyphenylacetate 3-monooxygenase
MGIRTGEELLQSLRDDRRLFIDGERVEDVTTDPRVAGAAQSLAELYDMQHDPALIERMTFLSPTSGERVGLSFIVPRSVNDLIRRREMVKIWMDATCGMFGRSPDFMSIFVTGFVRRPMNSVTRTGGSPRTCGVITPMSATTTPA